MNICDSHPMEAVALLFMELNDKIFKIKRKFSLLSHYNNNMKLYERKKKK